MTSWLTSSQELLFPLVSPRLAEILTVASPCVVFPFALPAAFQEVLALKPIKYCYRLNVFFPPKSICRNIILNVMVSEHGAFGRWLGHKGKPL